MKTFTTFVEERWGDQPSLPTEPQSSPVTSENIREILVKTRNLVSNFEPRDIEDCKDLLIELKEIIEEKLTGT